MTKSKNLGLNLPSRDNTTDLADINVISGNFETIDNEFGNVYNKLNNTGVVNTVSGNPIVLKDSAKAPLQNLKLYGTPTPTTSVEVGVYDGKNLYKNTATTTEVKGIAFTVNNDGSVTANGTATATSQFNLGTTRLPKGNYKATGYDGSISGVYLYSRASTDTGWPTVVGERNLTYTEDVNVYFLISIGAGATVNNLTFYPMIRLAAETDSTYEPCNKQTLTMPYILRSKDDVRDEIDFAKGLHIQRTDGSSIFEAPIETPLTEAELNAYRQLHTNKPNTTILSEADMEISYVADTKLYIDNKIAQLTALTLEV